jgi:MFS transporter, DHA1 family, multidrug resistance protein
VTWIDSKNPALLTFAILIFVIGQIIPSVILYPLCLSLMPQSKARISAIMQGLRLVLTALSLQVAGYFYQGSFQNIGIIILVFVVLSILSLYVVVRNKRIQKILYDQN